tara:strand:+ start:3458 stop:4081 length:624 start_codon:yes stop_codon:yes gene_type:complete
MVYKNFLLRLFFSIIFLLIYIIFSFINFNYIFFLIILIYFFIFFEIFIYFKKYKIIPIIYTLISLYFFTKIQLNNDIYLSFNLFILIVILFDIFSYTIGKSIGKKKIIKISPNKTLEGFLGGLSISFLFSLLFCFFINIIIDIKLILFIILIIMTSFMGDLIESFFKRKNYLKNSSEIIPGHGGVFDRFDSFIFSIIFYSIFYQFLS